MRVESVSSMLIRLLQDKLNKLTYDVRIGGSKVANQVYD